MDAHSGNEIYQESGQNGFRFYDDDAYALLANVTFQNYLTLNTTPGYFYPVYQIFNQLANQNGYETQPIAAVYGLNFINCDTTILLHSPSAEQPQYAHNEYFLNGTHAYLFFFDDGFDTSSIFLSMMT